MLNAAGNGVGSGLRLAASPPLIERWRLPLPADLLPYEQVEGTWSVLEWVNGRLDDFAQRVHPISQDEFDMQSGHYMTGQAQCNEFRTHLLEAQQALRAVVSSNRCRCAPRWYLYAYE